MHQPHDDRKGDLLAQRQSRSSEFADLLIEINANRQKEWYKEPTFRLAYIALLERDRSELFNSFASADIKAVTESFIKKVGKETVPKPGLALDDQDPDYLAVRAQRIEGREKLAKQIRRYVGENSHEIQDGFDQSVSKIMQAIDRDTEAFLDPESPESKRRYAMEARNDWLLRKSQRIPEHFKQIEPALSMSYAPGESESCWTKLERLFDRRYEYSKPLRDLVVKMVLLSEEDLTYKRGRSHEEKLSYIDDLRVQALPTVFKSEEEYIKFEEGRLKLDQSLKNEISEILKDGIVGANLIRSKSLDNPERARLHELERERYMADARRDAERAFRAEDRDVIFL